MNKPIIGMVPSITDDLRSYTLYVRYAKAIEIAGGIPLALPYVSEEEELKAVLDKCDGLLLPGGDDVDPAYFNEEILNETVTLTQQRDKFEMPLIKLAVELKKPLLAICRGIQIVNVTFGGDLYQDLPTQLNVKHHPSGRPEYTGHTVVFKEGSYLAKLFGSQSVFTNSYHHQAIRRVPECLTVVGNCEEDGVIEALVMENHPYFVCVQWHPEITIASDGPSRMLFDDFIEHCKSCNC